MAPRLQRSVALFTRMDTNSLIAITGVVGTVAWIVTIPVAWAMLDHVSLGWIVITLAVGWLLLTLGTAVYLRKNASRRLTNLFVWKLWLGLSVLGCLINIGAGVLLELDVATTIAHDYGGVLPWLLIYAVGYVATAVYEPNNQALSVAERAVYGIIGVLAVVFAGVLAVTPELYIELIVALAVLTLAQLLTIILR